MEFSTDQATDHLQSQDGKPEFDLKTKIGLMPLHCSMQEGYVKCAKMLLKYGANINVLGKDNQTPLYFACD
ncbi:hypothetical protein CDAR_380361 [Caerostris darwini]|uniref:Uncharacterized protein n=1 Tax=Caerostris darwini TaxID=1538125 RepID=A0AAV4TPP5_9ARAC|nr:hypothetical protein CDAR_380361 [Caerostris darwini]